MDVDPRTGAVKNRWITPWEMTGENQTGNPTGGITTQFTGAQPQRARLRATKAPIGLLEPADAHDPGRRPLALHARSSSSTSPSSTRCLANAPKVANGLVAGQYHAPTFEFIFPENVMPGDPIVPFDLWHLPFLRYGEGANTDRASARSSRRRGARRSPTCRRCPIRRPRPPPGAAAPAAAALAAPAAAPAAAGLAAPAGAVAGLAARARSSRGSPRRRRCPRRRPPAPA